ncbi:MAG: DNA translocase FtsK 4TM domain-containing protein [Lachnospiraceae bacterium]
MANNKSNSGKTSGKNDNNRSNTSKKTQKQIVENHNSYQSEIVVWIIVAVMLILELANFGLCGIINYVSQFLFGLFGVVEYVLPIIVIIAAFFLHVNEYKKRAVTKVILTALLCIFFGVMAQMLIGSFGMKAMYLDGFHKKIGGGVICGGLAFVINKLVGTVGTYIIMILAILVCIIFFAEISIIDGIRSLLTYTSDSEDDFDDMYEEKTKKRKSKNTDREQIVKEDFSKERMKDKKNVSMLEQLTVLPADADQGIIHNQSLDVNTKENVHEIKMDYEVLLPGEGMENITTEEKPKKKRRKPISPTVLQEPENPLNLNDKKDASYVPTSSIEDKTAAPVKSTTKVVSKDETGYQFPPMELLKASKGQTLNDNENMRRNAERLREVLESFGVGVTMQNYSCGPSVTRYEMIPDQGVKVSKITGLADDLMMNLAAQSIRIEAPIPGKRAVGIEIPNEERSGVGFRELIDSDKFKSHKSKIAFAVGKDIEGNVIVEDIAKMPHLLIAGATGSGKSVCTNTLIMSILYKARPDEVKLILIDPKQVELKVYNGIPHLLSPVVTDPKKAAGALNWAVGEMTKRYQQFSELNVRNIQGYNEKVRALEKAGDESEVHLKPMPQIVIIVDELADLMMVAKAEVEEAIVRLAQLARAAGIHLVIATQRPSVDVVTGLIKANVPSRIALSVSSGVDSRTIIDSVGAEKLLGNGDMLFYPTNYPKPLRVQGAYISDDEVVSVVDFLKSNCMQEEEQEDISTQFVSGEAAATVVNNGNGVVEEGNDEYFYQAGKFIIEKDKASIGMLQRMFRIGFNRAARIMDQLHAAGVVGAEEGTKPRQVLMTLEEFDAYCENQQGDNNQAMF